ncbi:MAG: hypothetical protein IPN76_11715 [Saprospiraceae bacterium]|nr:hypothetical protein [Saprospiraceae bacterium]
MTNENPHLFLFSVGPVQSFIAQARKTQDLYAGSRILGELIYAASVVANRNQIEFVFPKEIEKNGSIPNRFLGKISGKSESEMQDIGDQIEKAAQKRFKELAENALADAKVDSVNGFYCQIAKHLEINWLFHPISGESDEAYRRAYKEIETLMASVKNVRVFEQFDCNMPTYGEAGRKCSLDGERNALFFGDGTDGRYALQGKKLKKGDVRIAQNEGLSAVSLTKRFYEKKDTFASTAEIATMNLTSANKGFSKYTRHVLVTMNGTLNYASKKILPKNTCRKMDMKMY